jgi:hypothetical protein
MRTGRTTDDLLREPRVLLRVGFPFLMSIFVRRDVSGITIGRRIWLRPEVLERGERYLIAILEHELIHVRQYERDGILRFLFRYVAEYLRGRFRGLSHFEAYSAISYEREARGDSEHSKDP